MSISFCVWIKVISLVQFIPTLLDTLLYKDSVLGPLCDLFDHYQALISDENKSISKNTSNSNGWDEKR